MGRDFLGCYDLLHDRLLLVERAAPRAGAEGETCRGSTTPSSTPLLPADAVAKLREEVEMARELCPPFDLESYREGHLTPVFFGSALNNFGVRELLQGVADWRRRRARSRPSARSMPVARTRSAASSSRSRRTWTPSTATASPSCASAPATSSAA
jgi:peptide subunit release factor RF-3